MNSVHLEQTCNFKCKSCSIHYPSQSSPSYWC